MPATLSEALAQLTVPALKDLLEYFPNANLIGRKDEVLGRIMAGMFGPALQTIWSGLDPTQQVAVAEAVHHPNGEFSRQRFFAKYKCMPALKVKGIKGRDYSEAKQSALGLFFHYSRDLRCTVIPADLKARLKAWVPTPVPMKLAGSDTPADREGLTTRLTEQDALHEVLATLHAVERTRLQVSEKSALPNAGALRALTDKFPSGDYFPWREKKRKWDQEIGPIKAFAWLMLLQAGALAIRTGSHLALGPAGVKALSTPPADILRELWRKWLKSTLLDEFSRVDAIKGQNSKGRVMSAVGPRRMAIDLALQECPVGRWVTLDGFSRFMQASELEFDVTHNASMLYLAERQYGSLGYGKSDGWNILQERYILAVLFEYAATLGMVDVAYVDPAGARNDFSELWGAEELMFLSCYDGLIEFRLTPLGAYILGIEAAYHPRAIASDVALSVLPSLQVKVVRGSLSATETLLLENWAITDESGNWRLDHQRALSAVEQGYDIAELQSFLEHRDDQPLPELVGSFIRQCARNGKALKILGNAVLIECRDSDAVETIATHKETSSLCCRAGPQWLVVRAEQLGKFRERVHVLGYGLPAGVMAQ